MLVVTLLLILEGLMFGLFTSIMCGTQLSAICSDETVTQEQRYIQNDRVIVTAIYENLIIFFQISTSE